MTPAQAILRRTLRALGVRLPSRAQRQLWLRLFDEGCGFADIADIVEADPLLVEDVLRVEMQPRRITVRKASP